MERAKQVAEGSLIFFGPELVGGGNLPGGFYYYLLSIPYLLGLDWSACWRMMIILLSMGIGLAWTFIVSIFGYFGAVIFISLVFNSAALLLVEGLFLNPSFLPFFTILSIIGLCLTFSKISVSKNRYWIATCLLLGLTMQIHFNAFFILLSGIFLQLIARRIKISSLTRWSFVTGLIVFVLTILPYCISNFVSNFGIVIGQQAPSSSGNLINAPPYLFFRLFYGLLGADLESTLRMLMFQLQPEMLICLFILPFGCWVYSHIVRKDYPTNQQEIKHYELFRILVIISVFNVIPQLIFVIINGFNSVYYTINVIFVMAFLTITIPLKELKERQKEMCYYLTFACLLIIAVYKYLTTPALDIYAMFKISALYYVVIFVILASIMTVKRISSVTISLVVFMLLIPNISLKYNLSIAEKSMKLDKRIPCLLKLEDMKKISRHIVKETCWDFETARKKIMRMNILSELGFKQLYNSEYKSVACCKSIKNPDGYIITNLKNADDKDKLFESPNRWLFSERPLHIIHEYMVNHNLRVGNPVIFGNAVLLEYYLKDSHTGNSLSIQNIGYSYEENTFERYFEEYPIGVSAIGKGQYFIHWNNCAERAKCSIGYILDLKSLSFIRDTVKISIIGSSLAVSSKSVAPDWSEMLISPYITFICDKKKYKRELVKRLGGTLNNAPNSDLISAPFETQMENPCKNNSYHITIGWDNLVLTSFSQGMMIFPDEPVTIFNIESNPR